MTTKKPTSGEYKRRLLRLAAKLERTPRKRFNFNTWVGDNWKGKQDLSCGTTACGLGLATTLPSLRRAGLQLARIDGVGRGYVKLRWGRTASVWEEALRVSLKAAQTVFGISYEEADRLFIPSYRPGRLPDTTTPKRLARHIRNFVKNWKEDR